MTSYPCMLSSLPLCLSYSVAEESHNEMTSKLLFDFILCTLAQQGILNGQLKSTNRIFSLLIGIAVKGH